MSITIEEVPVAERLAMLQELHNANRERQASAARFEWSYLRNPCGPARAWVARDDATQAAVGFSAVFPRSVRVHGQPVAAWTTGDFSVSRNYRTLGVALKLRRAARSEIDRGGGTFFWSHPNPQATPLHERLGHARIGALHRVLKPLALPRGPAWLAAVTRRPAAWFSADRRVPRLPGAATVGVEVPNDVEALYAHVADDIGTSIVRSRAYWTWRFVEHPIEPCRIVTVRQGGRLRGTAAIVFRDTHAALKDWLAEDDAACAELLAATLDAAREAGSRWMSAIMLERHRFLPVFDRLGFLRRPETGLVYGYARADLPWKAEVLDAQHWYMTAGDRDA